MAANLAHIPSSASGRYDHAFPPKRKREDKLSFCVARVTERTGVSRSSSVKRHKSGASEGCTKAPWL
jgi:hypothetical protein